MKYKFFIPSAGLGSRLDNLTKYINKSLISVNNKPSISYIIEKIDDDIEIVIALGYKGKLLRDFLELSYPNKKFTFVDIDIYEGVGSGLGYTLLKCQEHLQCPFVFSSNDTIVLEDIPIPNKNWIGYSDYKANGIYRKIIHNKGMLDKLCEKDDKSSDLPYIGLSGIYDYDIFWKIMNDDVNYGSITGGESHGLKKLLEIKDIESIKFTWFDTGTVKSIDVADEYFRKENSPNILRKPDESIWFVGGNVIKYSENKDFIKDRVERSKILKGYVPDIIDYKDNLYSYKMVNGEVLSRVANRVTFNNLLDFMAEFWKKKNLSTEEKDNFKKESMKFYKDKTYKRVYEYFNRFNYFDRTETINGMKIPTLMSILDKVDWDYISDGIPVNFHGDLHFENILLSENNEFVLLDWRQRFGDNITEYGDLYYDLSKLMHGLIVSHDIVNKNMFDINVNDDYIKFDILRTNTSVECENIFKEFMMDNSFDYNKVMIMTALIYLNIASLHHYPYSKFLFYLGKYMLYNLIEK